MIVRAFKESNRWIFSVWYDRWFVWLLLFGGVELFNQMLVKALDGFEASQVAYLMAGLVSSSLDFTLALMVPPVLMGLKKGTRINLWTHQKKYLNQACIESLRATARVCWFSYLLIIPGLIKFLRLQFVPYVVQFDQRYDEGKKDALKTSEFLTKGALFKVLLVYVICMTIGSIESLRSTFSWDSPYFAMAFLLTLPLRLYTQIVWFSFYESLVERSSS